MLRTSIIRSASIIRAQRFAPAVLSARYMTTGEGATGAGYARPTGEAGGDSFTKREKAVEDYYIRQKEKEKLIELRDKLRQQKKHLDDLDAHIEELTRDHQRSEKK
ncbi:mitochondrial ATPase inhibitor, IATP-domain-containing protein [Kalaharituber pfeilii]|nr:mitochondrial ATPase inhibitor, IATP-domain-containing protein [Kalaharituber pfeilii]